MNSQEARFTLQSYRPGTEDEQDPVFQEALQLVDTDSELAAWFEDQSAFDAAMREKLGGVEPPADLPASILAGMRATAANVEPEVEEEIIPDRLATTQRSFWVRPETLSIAAIFLVLFAWIDPLSLRGFRADPGLADASLPPVLAHLTDHYEGFSGFDKESDSWGELSAFLTSNQAVSPRNIPAQIAEDTPMGGVSIEFQGSSIGMICFRDGLNVMHLYSAPENAFPPEVFGAEKKIFEDRGRGYKVWREDGQAYVLATEGKVDRLKEIF